MANVRDADPGKDYRRITSDTGFTGKKILTWNACAKSAIYKECINKRGNWICLIVTTLRIAATGSII